MWLDKDNNEDPYNRGNVAGKTIDAPNVGSGAGGGAPLGAGEGNQTNATPAGSNPVAAVPQQKSATVQDYLGANKEQGNQLGKQFESKLNDVGTKDTQAIDSAASNVKTQAQAGATAYDPTLVSKAVSDPTKVANDPNQLQSFLKQWNAAYTGPASFEGTDDYNKANAAATDAQTHATEVGDAGGRKQILQDDFGVYGQGNKGLDHTLLQNADNFGSVLDTGKNLASLPNYLTSKAADVNATATKAAADTAATKANTQAPFANGVQNLQTDLTGRVAADLSTATANNNQVKTALASGDAKQVNAALTKLGLNAPSIQDYLTTLNGTYGVKPDLTNYDTYNPATSIDKNTVATSADYAKAAALQKLTGADYSSVLNPANASKANTWNNPSSGIDFKNLGPYLQGQIKQQDTEALSKTNLQDLSTKMNIPNMTDSKNSSNVQAGTQAALAIVGAMSRLGMTTGTANGGQANNLDNLYHQAAAAFTLAANNGDSQGMHGTNPNNPAIAGLRQFVNVLGRNLYGSRYTAY